MTAADGILVVIAAAAVAYTVLGGADFGGGVWDLLAIGAHGGRQRALIARTMGPVWEANHVWLIFVLIGGFSGFPAAFGALSRLLAIPLALALLGIVLRGAAFVFRQYPSERRASASQPRSPDLPRHGSMVEGPAVPGPLAWGRVFAVASAMTPIALGWAAGGWFTGSAGGYFPPYAGALMLAFCAYLAAVFLCREAGSDVELVAGLRRRALTAAAVAGTLSVGGLPVLALDTPGHTLPGWCVAASVAGGASSILALVRRQFVAARVCAALAVAAVVAGALLARYPMLAPGLPIEAAAAPPSTLGLTLAVLVVGFAVTVPSLLFLLRTFDRPVRS